jgi:hypothetical protein
MRPADNSRHVDLTLARGMSAAGVAHDRLDWQDNFLDRGRSLSFLG